MAICAAMLLMNPMRAHAAEPASEIVPAEDLQTQPAQMPDVAAMPAEALGTQPVPAEAPEMPPVPSDLLEVLPEEGLDGAELPSVPADSETALLTSVGSGICGAAAVLGAESTIQTKPFKTAVAVATVVIFGTIAMFIYPVAYRAGILGLSPGEMGIFAGSTLHEVAHAVGAGNAMGEEIASTAIIVKMIRVMLLVPVLLILAYWVALKRSKSENAGSGKAKIAIPWFALGFLAVIGFNSFDLLPAVAVDTINYIDTFLLTMAMAALGAETSIDKFRKAGPKPFILAAILFVWLMVGGWLMAKFLAPLFL